MLEPRRKTRTLSAELADTLGQRIRNQEYPPSTKLPKEMDIMEEFGVSRTVVREAISHLQAAGMAETRHGIGTFALLPEENGFFRVHPDQISTLRDTIPSSSSARSCKVSMRCVMPGTRRRSSLKRRGWSFR